MSITLFLIFGCMAENQTPLRDGIRAQLEVNVINNQKYGQLIAVSVCLRNDLKENYFIDGSMPLVMRILQEKDSLKYVDITEEWMYEEMFFLEKDSLYKIFINSNSKDVIFDPIESEFVNSDAAGFYSDQLMKHRSKIKNSDDKEIIKKWVRYKFEGILYLDKDEVHCKTFSINTLKPGKYKLFFYYSENELVSVDDSRGFINSLDLKLPAKISGYKKWSGAIASDTLHINIK